MKKIFSIILILTGCIFATVDERNVDVYFANGIATDRTSAYKASDKIKEKFQVYNPTLYNSVADWNISYNHTHGIGIDLYESMIQKIYEDKPGKSFLPFIWNAGSLSSLLDLSFKGIVKKIAQKTPKPLIKNFATKQAKKLAKQSVSFYNKKYAKKFTEEEIKLMFEEVFNHLIEEAVQTYIDKTEDEIIQQELTDLNKHLKSYRKSIIDGHGVVVIAHSQGNFFANRAYEEFGAPANPYLGSWMQNYFHALGVATPANNVLGGKNPYITFDNDMIRLIPDSLPSNVTNPQRYHLYR